MASKQINPKLIHALTNKPLADIPPSPTFKHLRGIYVRSIVDQMKKIKPMHPKNEMKMTCKVCGRSNQYNIGMLVINMSELKNNKLQQFSGYFRCINCNAGSQWQHSAEIQILTANAILSPYDYLPVQFGEVRLFDGTTPQYATDGEEHLLSLIAASPKNSLLWNKLGNLYLIGSRPELAMAAFEKSIELDPEQFESQFSIAGLLMQIKNYEHAIKHLYHMMISAYTYAHVEKDKLKELLATGIQTSFYIETETKKKYAALPTQQQFADAGSPIVLESKILPTVIDIYAEGITPFFPLAEQLMGKRLQKGKTPEAKNPQQKMTKSQQVQDFIDAQQNAFTKAEIQQACPEISAATISRVVNELRKNERIEMIGQGRNTQWRMKVE